ncbi:MAG: thiamine-monophosphate kinase [Moritella sp.]|jgi:thiamine-monophosphate kinase
MVEKRITMATGEFDLIGQYFTNQSVERDDVIQGIGDDCAILALPAGKHLVVTTDTMVTGVHFLADADPADVAHKLVAVNMSDLAAMGAEPAWASLALTLPDYDRDWLAKFSDSLHLQLRVYGVSLIGGDTTKGPMTLTLTVQGFAQQGNALQRRGAKAGDLIYCSGSIGDAAAGLALLQTTDEQNMANITASDRAFLVGRHQRPTARIEAGLALVGIASSCIDLSDGLASDLKHILRASSHAEPLAADIELTQLPLSLALQRYLPAVEWPQYALAGGDDYELLFTVPAEHEVLLTQAMQSLDLACNKIGIVTQPDQAHADKPVEMAQINYFYNNTLTALALQGWDHFQ